ncbi:MAG: universal stress protein [Actinomycetota bacterium]
MYTRILVGTDGSATAAKAVERAVQVAASSGARLTIMSAGRSAKAEPVVAAARDAHVGSGVDVDTLVVEKDPVRALIDTAREGGYDLVVVGNKGMTGVGRFFHLGSVPNKVTHHLPCNLLIVKTS